MLNLQERSRLQNSLKKQRLGIASFFSSKRYFKILFSFLLFFLKGKSCNFLHPCKCNNCQFHTFYDHIRDRKLTEEIIWISSNNYDLRKSVRAKQSFLQKWIHTFVIICDCILYEPMVIGNWVLFKVLWSLCPCIRLVGEGKQRKK